MKELKLYELEQVAGGSTLLYDLGYQFGRWVERFDNSHIPAPRRHGYNPYA